MPFIAATGIMLSERDLVIDGRQINLWALHKLVFLRNGFESVRFIIISSSAVPTSICIRYLQTMSGPLLVPLWVSLHFQVGMLASLHGADLP